MRINQLATVVPKNGYTTDELMTVFPCELPDGVKQNVLNLGVAKRYLINQNPPKPTQKETFLNDKALINLGVEACEKAVKKTHINIDDIGFFIATYDATPFLSPGLSQILVRHVGFDPYVKHVNAHGIASTAFPKALELAGNFLAAHPDEHVLIFVSGISSYWLQNQVRGIRNVMEIGQINRIKDEAKRRFELRKWVAAIEYFLFGDGVAAALVSNGGEGLSVENIVEVTNIDKADCSAGYARLTALSEPFKFGFVSHLDRQIPDLGVKYTGLALERLLGKDIKAEIKASKKWAVHTGSEKILNLLAEHQGIEHEKLKESHDVLRKYGNLAGASLPFILEKIVSTNKLSMGDVILMVGYGWGFSASASKLIFHTGQ